MLRSDDSRIYLLHVNLVFNFHLADVLLLTDRNDSQEF
jgi:hypothetical protein